MAYIISGVVTEAGSPVEREVRAYERSTGALSGSGSSDPGTGEFTIFAANDEEHYVVAIDDAESGDDFNALIFDRVVPFFDETVDEHFDKVVALLHFDGTDGSTTFTDETGRSWTAVNQAQIDTAQSKWGTGSLLMDGNSDAISTVDDAALEPGAGSFSLECWVRFNALPTDGNYEVFFSKGSTSPNICFDFYFARAGATYRLEFAASTNGTSFNIIVNRTWTAPAINTWYFIQFTREAGSGAGKFAVDGVQLGADVTVSGTLFNGSAPLRIGADALSPTDGINGWIDDARYTVGLVRPIALPTAPFPSM